MNDRDMPEDLAAELAREARDLFLADRIGDAFGRRRRFPRVRFRKTIRGSASEVLSAGFKTRRAAFRAARRFRDAAFRRLPAGSGLIVFRRDGRWRFAYRPPIAREDDCRSSCPDDRRRRTKKTPISRKS